MFPNITAEFGIHFRRTGLITEICWDCSFFGNIQRSYGFVGMAPSKRLHGLFGGIAHPETNDLAHMGRCLGIWVSFSPPSTSVLKMKKLERDIVRH